MGFAGEPKSIKNRRSGDLLIQYAKESHEKSLLQLKTFCGLKCSVTPNSSLKTSKGIVRCPALSKVTNRGPGTNYSNISHESKTERSSEAVIWQWMLLIG